MPNDWLQIRGDPSIREFLFLQERKLNEFDKYMDNVLSRVADLLCNYGVFHAKVHFSSGQVTLWLVDDPLRYRVHVKEEFLNLDAFNTYPLKPYTSEAIVKQQTIMPILEGFKKLRLRANAEGRIQWIQRHACQFPILQVSTTCSGRTGISSTSGRPHRSRGG